MFVFHNHGTQSVTNDLNDAEEIDWIDSAIAAGCCHEVRIIKQNSVQYQSGSLSISSEMKYICFISSLVLHHLLNQIQIKTIMK